MRHTFLVLLLGACGGGASPSIDAASSGPIDAAVLSADGGGNHQEVFASFGTIETIAGTGLIEDKGENGWQIGFEGGAATSAELSRPHMTLADTDGNLFIADKDAHAIRRVDTSGTITTFAGTNAAGDSGDGPDVALEMQLSSPNGVWVGATGTVYVLDLGNDKVRRIEGGTMDTLFTIGGASTGRGLWVADDESLAYVAAGSALKKWTPAGGVEILASGFVSLGNIFVKDSGEILVADRGGHRIYAVANTGEKTVVAGNGSLAGGGDGQPAVSTGLNEVRGVWGHPSGGYFVATHKGGQIWFVDDAGTIHLFVNGDADDSHAGDGLAFDDPAVRISEPRAVSMDRAGNLLITEHDGGFIRRVNVTSR